MNFRKIILYIEIFLAAVIIFAGIIIRTKVYLADLSFWVDEDALIRSSYKILNWEQPFFRGLEAEYAPPLFLLLSSFIYKLFGVKELAFRFLPFLASVCILPAFAVLAKKTIKTPFLFLIPLIWVCVNEQLIFYSQYWKFYSTDFLCFILISIMLFNFNINNINRKKVLIYSITAAVLCWCAYSSIFYITGITLFLAAFLLFKRIKNQWLNWLIFSAPSFIMIGIYTIEVHLRRVNIDYIYPAWHEFGNFFPKTIQDISNLFVYHTTIFPHKINLILIPAAFVIGLFILYKKYSFRAFLFISPLVVMLFLALFDKFPFIERQTLYLMTLWLIILINSIDFISFWEMNKKAVLLPVISLCILFPIFRQYNFSYLSEIWKNNDYFRMSTSREFYKFLKEEYKNGDLIYSAGRDSALRLFDLNKDIIDFNDVIEQFSDFENRIRFLTPDTTIHIYLYDYPYVHDDYIKLKNIIETQCITVKTVKDGEGQYVKFKRIPDSN